MLEQVLAQEARGRQCDFDALDSESDKLGRRALLPVSSPRCRALRSVMNFRVGFIIRIT